MSKLKRSATISIHSGLRNIIKGYCSKLDSQGKVENWLTVTSTKTFFLENSQLAECEDAE